MQNNTINGRTPEEIKKGLECRNRVYLKTCGFECDECDCFVHPYSVANRYADALAYIQQLEDIFHDLTKKIEQFERERDAAVEDLKSVVASNYFDGDYCKLCKYKVPDGKCHHRCIPYSSEWGWQWRGVQEVT